MLAELFGADLIWVVIIVAILLVGGSQIPKLARNLGSAKNQFEQGMKDGKAEAEAASKNGTSAAADAPAQAPTPPAEGKS